MRRRVLIACPHLQRELPRFMPLFDQHETDVEAPPVEQALSESYLLDNIHRFDGVVAGDDCFSAAVLERGKRLRVIAKWGVGVDNIDLDKARSLGIQVLNTPGQLSSEVADVVIGYLVMLARRLHEINAEARAGNWAQIRGVSLAGKTLGVVGFGGIGRAVCRRALAMEMTVVAHDPYVAGAIEPALQGVKLMAMDDLLSQSHFVSLNCNLTADNHHLIDAAALSLMRPGSYLVNTSRGALVDEAALTDALARGHLAGAALDVFEDEPLPASSPLRQFPQCIFGAHNCSNTQDAVDRINALAVQNLLGVLAEAA